MSMVMPRKIPLKETVKASPASAPKEVIHLSFEDLGLIGNGAFGNVIQAKLCDSQKLVAIKTTKLKKSFVDRELSFMLALDHCNIVKLLYFFFRPGNKKEDKFLSMVMEFMPTTVCRYVGLMRNERRVIPAVLTKLMMYQLFRSLAFIHAQNICHRDVKPENILFDPNTGILKLGDLGSAKRLEQGVTNVSYICSRYCRPPELMFGSVYYTTYVDMWSSGCVFAQILLGKPLFAASCNVDQLVEVIKVLGTPTKEQIKDLNPKYVSYNFPVLEPTPLNSMFSAGTPSDAIDLLSNLLVYKPLSRLHPFRACAHPFFYKLLEKGTVLPNGSPLPPISNFTDSEKAEMERLNVYLTPTQFA